MDDPARWSDLWQKLGLKSNPQPAFDHLVQAYAEPQRAYHTLEHIRDCLAQFDQVSMLAERPVEVETALWLHDVVYDPRASDNEERSAGWAENVLGRHGAPAVVIERICDLILATKHRAAPAGGDTTLLADIDLSILGRDVKTFERYERQIRQEYRFVPEQAFRQGRAKILETFLEREFIYQVFFFRERYEARARENLSGSISRLRGELPLDSV
jgi:predicted metal-dependent HD superfamily phosphohydrolase